MTGQGETGDLYLLQLVSLTLRAIATQRPLFASPLDEPVLYRRVEGWVREALEERRAMQAVRAGVQAQLAA
ncbi:MAG TPA: hypothetical protein VFF68_11940 [Anaerolineaceae bacterium]|nr:hypothetical protein [Anaerolineaceae bacterium]